MSHSRAAVRDADVGSSSELFRTKSPEKSEVEAMLIDDDSDPEIITPEELPSESRVKVTMPTSVSGDRVNLTPVVDEGVVNEAHTSSKKGRGETTSSERAHDDLLKGDSNLLASLPVYFSTSLPSTSSLQIFQYPTYPRGAPLPVPESARSRGHRPALRHRSKAQRVEVELPLDLRTAVYNLDKGQEMGKGASVGGQIGPVSTSTNVKIKKEHGVEDGGRAASKRLERTRLDSTLIPPQTQYMIGVIRDKALHLTPVDTMIQLRPSMHYLDVLDAMSQQEKRRAQAEPGEDTDEGSMTEDGNRAAKEKKKAQSLTVSVREASGTTGAKKGGVADSRDVLMQADREAEAERWVDLDWKDERSDEAKKIFDAHLFASSKTPLACRSRPQDFLKC